jgi:hypothetical protein
MRIVRLTLLAALAVALVAPAGAADKVFDGTLVCAKCYLKKADAKECQDVLLVRESSGANAEYYITKNDVARKSGEACTTEVKAKVTGTVSQRDGKTWLTPSKIEKQ